MAEGGMYPWKIQKFMKWGPVGDYRNLRDPLPRPPLGKEWRCDPETREWSLVNVPEEKMKKAAAATAGGILSTVGSSLASPKRIPKPSTKDGSADGKLKAEMPELAEEKVTVVDNLPPPVPRRESTSSYNLNHGSLSAEDEWEMLSGGAGSHSTNMTGGGLVVVKAGSVRSIASFEDGRSQHSNSHNTPLSVPFKIQRTASNSTIDSADNALGPSGLGILGVDYVEHVILPTDTLQGICLAYKISSTRLRQANHFSGHSLSLAPKKLVIPLSKKALRSGCIRAQDTDAKEYKVHAFLAEFPNLSMTEAKAYLELADWVLKDAIRSAKEDGEWEKEIDASTHLSPGEIRITYVEGGSSYRGAGISPKAKAVTPRSANTETANAQPKTMSKDEEEKDDTREELASTLDAATSDGKAKAKPVVATSESMASYASKTVKPEDVYNAAHQHDNFGFELKQIGTKKANVANC